MADSDFPFYRPGRSEYDDNMSRASTEVKRRRKVDDEKFALGRRGILVFFTLSVLTLMAALDGTSLSVALPVSASVRRFDVLKLTRHRKLQKNSMEQPSKHSGVELRSCYARQVSGIMFPQRYDQPIYHCHSIPTKLRLLLEYFRPSTNDHHLPHILLCRCCNRSNC